MVSRSWWVRFFGFGIVTACGTLLLLLPNAAQAQGVTRNWTGSGATDDWFDPANWSPAGSPNADDFLFFDIFDVAGLNTNNFVVRNGGRILVSSDTASVTLNQLFLGRDGEGLLTMSAGTLTTSSVSIGGNSNSFGTASISGFTSLWDITSSPFSDLIVGDSGEGQLNILVGADVNVADGGFIGNGSLGTGVVDISGSGSTLNFTGVVSSPLN